MITASTVYRIIFVHPESASWIQKLLTVSLSFICSFDLQSTQQVTLYGLFMWGHNMKVMLRRDLSTSLEGISCSTILSFLIQAISACHILLSLQHSQLALYLELAVACLVGRWTHWKSSVNAAVTSCELHFLPPFFHKTFIPLPFYSHFTDSSIWTEHITNDTATDRNKCLCRRSFAQKFEMAVVTSSE